MKEKSIVFMGTPEFAVASLNALVEAGVRVAAVVTAPDRPAGRGLKQQGSAVKQRAIALGLPVLQPEKLRDPVLIDTLRSLGADLFVVVAFRMLPEVVWSMPPLGTINLHASLLPRYRGAAPINWAIMNGEKVTGVTTFLLDKQIDTGDILDQRSCPIGPETSAGELHDTLMVLGAELLTSTVKDLFTGTAKSSPQVGDGRDAPTHAPKLTPEICRVDWTRPAQEVHDHIRGLDPHPGAWSTLVQEGRPGSRVKVFASRVVEGGDLAVGAVTTDRNGITVGCGQGALRLESLRPEGRKRMSGADFTRGLQAGTDLHFV